MLHAGASSATPTFSHRVLKSAAAAVDRVRRPVPGIVVLIYHRVGGRSGLAVDLDSGAFDDQMAWLAASGRVVTFERALDLLASNAAASGDGDPAAPDNPIVVTFDDGTADFADIAVPILDRHQVPALMYLATDFIERGDAFPDDGAPMSWNAVRDCRSTGLVDFGSHTHTHALLDRLRPDEIDAELDRSMELIAEHLGVPARDFAYPKALAPSAAADVAVRRRFRSAVLAGTRANRIGATDPFRIARSPIQTYDGFAYFVRKAEGGMAFEDSARNLVNRVRYAGATS